MRSGRKVCVARLASIYLYTYDVNANRGYGADQTIPPRPQIRLQPPRLQIPPVLARGAPRPPKRCPLHILPPHPLHHQLAAHGRSPAVLCLARVRAVTTVGGRCGIRSL